MVISKGFLRGGATTLDRETAAHAVVVRSVLFVQLTVEAHGHFEGKRT
jgi:hypothetical protein